MSQNKQHISAHKVVAELIPKLNATERQVNQTLSSITGMSQSTGNSDRYARLKAEFSLELTMIRLNLDHLLKRYSKELDAVMSNPQHDVLLNLDLHEATAIESAQQLYKRVQQLQQRQ